MSVAHAYAQTEPLFPRTAVAAPHMQLGMIVVSLGLLLAAVGAGIALIRTRTLSVAREAALRAKLGEARSQLDRAETMLAAEQHIMIVFGAPGEEPEVTGDLSARIAVPAGRRILGFGAWLSGENVVKIEQCVDALRARGEAFQLTLPTKNGHHVAIDGRAIGGRAVVRIRDVSGEHLQLAELTERHAEMMHELGRLRTLLDVLPQPAWVRDKLGQLSWVNRVFAQAVEVADSDAAIAKKAELLDRPVRDEAAQARNKGETFHKRVAAVMAGQRRMFDVVEAPCGEGSAGMAVDVSELEEVRTELARRGEAHRRTLDELATGVAIFKADGTLAFHNQAYRQLWNLDPAFLEQGVTDTTILDRLRADRKLPEQADFRGWKAQLHEAYRAIEPREHWWHLPNGRTLRVVQTPNPEGGVTYLFDDVSERINLESRYNALMSVQSETLDNLQEGVAVFGSDGRLKLHNPSFAKLWKLSESDLDTQPHADAVFTLCRKLHPREEAWRSLKSSITAAPENRKPASMQMERNDDKILDVATVPLPDGGTLFTFMDVTAGVAMERALRERNEALEAAAQLKSDFVKHVSYELRSPLTNIIGFTQLLGDTTAGPLTSKQEEYAGHILDSSAALLAIINDILDLATIDAGAMELHLSEVDIRATMDAAAEGVRDRLSEADLKLEISAPPSIGAFHADEKRVRQVLFNLLSNAIGFSPNGSTVTLAAERQAEAVIFRITDHGRGIAPEMAGRVFERFESHTQGSRHRGVGLGLSIVRSFVELHGGSVKLDSTPGEGTTVTCIFPLERGTAQVAAE